MSLVPSTWPYVCWLGFPARSLGIPLPPPPRSCPVLVALLPGLYLGLDLGRAKKAPFKLRNVAGYLFTNELSECCAERLLDTG